MSNIIKLPDDENLWSEFHRYFIAFVVGDIEKSLQVGIEVGTIILTTVGIECLGGYYSGRTIEKSSAPNPKEKRKRERIDFVKFMQDFMPSYKKYADDIYACIRNGLAHDYVTNTVNNKTFLFKRDYDEQHLSPLLNNPNVVYLNREKYALDFLEAQRKYFEKVESEQVIWNNAIQRLRSRKGFLTVRPENLLVNPPTEAHYPGTLENRPNKSYPTGTSINQSDTI